MKSFDINRFGKTLRWLVSENRLMLLSVFLGVMVAVLLLEIMTTLLVKNPSIYLRNIAGFIIFAMAVMALAFVSGMFTNFTSIGSRQQRCAYMMLPATNLEKFLAVVFYVTVICTVCMAVAMVLGDTMRMGVMAAWDRLQPLTGASYVPDGTEFQESHWWTSALPKVWERLWAISDIPSNGHTLICDNGGSKIVTVCSAGYTILRYVLLLGSLMWVHSLFTMGGTLLRKYTFVVSGVVVILAILLYEEATDSFGLYLYEHVVYYSDNKDGFKHIEYAVSTVRPLAYVVAALVLLLSAFNYWASFHIFKHFELISNKWTNYDILKR